MVVNIITTPIIDYLYSLDWLPPGIQPFTSENAVFYDWYVAQMPTQAKYTILQGMNYGIDPGESCCIILKKSIKFDSYVGDDFIIKRRRFLWK